jgi:hypothetical protein
MRLEAPTKNDVLRCSQKHQCHESYAAYIVTTSTHATELLRLHVTGVTRPLASPVCPATGTLGASPLRTDTATLWATSSRPRAAAATAPGATATTPGTATATTRMATATASGATTGRGSPCTVATHAHRLHLSKASSDRASHENCACVARVPGERFRWDGVREVQLHEVVLPRFHLVGEWVQNLCAADRDGKREERMRLDMGVRWGICAQF